MKSPFYLSICAIFSFMFLSAQNTQKSILTFQQKTQATVTLSSSGNPEFIKFPLNAGLGVDGNSIEDKTLSFLDENSTIFGLNSENNEFIVEKSETDQYGLKHVVVNQLYEGVPIFDGKLHFHFNRDEKLTSVNGNVLGNLKLSPIPSLTLSVANTIAVQTVENQNLNHSGEPLKVIESELFVFQKGLVQGYSGSNYLVYKVEVRNDLDVREFLFVNAYNGEIVEQFTGMAHALDRVVYEENTSSVAWQEGNNFPGILTIWQQNEVEASGHMYNFFNNAFGYVSYDGADARMRTINNNPNIACPNANWNGVTANYCDGTASDDVIGHEWGHAYDQYTSNLIYAWQSGALDESFADIWGETIDILNGYEDDGEDLSLRGAGCNSDRWKIGEDASAFGGAIRDMWNPPCRNQPGKVTDGQYWCSDGDSGGVHFNSGVPNHAYAMLVDGDTYNGYTINGIGFTKAAHIFWRAQSQYLTSTSDFAVMADALETSANDLIGINLEGLSTSNIPVGLSGEMITTDDVQQVVNAILAVELRTNPDNCGFVLLLPPLSEEVCVASTNNPVFFEDWESGLGNWTLDQLPEASRQWVSRDWEIQTNLPNGRDGNAIFGIDPNYGFDCNSNLQNGIIRLQSPVITLPDYPNGTFDMAFNHNVSTEPEWDGGNIKYSVNGGSWTVLPASAFTENPYNSTINSVAAGNDNPMASEPAFTGADGGSNTSLWGTSVIDLSQIGGVSNSTIQFRFDMGTDGCNGSIGWYIDEIMIYNCTELLSIDEFSALSNMLNVYPNPSSGLFTLRKTNSVDLISSQIFDINGRLIRTIDLSNMNTDTTIDLSNVASGLYFMTVKSTDSKAVIKLIKN